LKAARTSRNGTMKILLSLIALAGSLSFLATQASGGFGYL
jgi:hypothetical protein